MIMLASFAPAQSPDLSCADFLDQAAAQRALNGNPADPFQLDRDGDGVACEKSVIPSVPQLGTFVIVGAFSIGVAILARVYSMRAGLNERGEGLAHRLSRVSARLRQERAIRGILTISISFYVLGIVTAILAKYYLP
jgi:hypothetical protein